MEIENIYQKNTRFNIDKSPFQRTPEKKDSKTHMKMESAEAIPAAPQ